MNHFNKRIANIPQNLWVLINQIDELKGQWVGGAKINPQALGRLRRSVLVTSTGASTRIEGAKLSDEDIEKMMRGLSMQKFADRDIQEVQGYYELLENVFNAWNSIPLSESTIKHLHRELLKYVEKDKLHRGEYKKIENKVEMVNEAGQSIGTLFDTTPAYLTPKEMQEIVEWAREAIILKEIHPFLIIGNFLVEFLNIHPFQDGNGRLSRVLTNLLLLQSGYAHIPYVSLEEIIEERKTDYYLSLRQTQKNHKTDNEDISAWIDFILDVLIEQTARAKVLIDAKQPEKLLSQKQISVYELFADGSILGAKEIVERLIGEVARPTVKKTLSRLVELKLLERLGRARSTRYRKI